MTLPSTACVSHALHSSIEQHHSDWVHAVWGAGCPQHDATAAKLPRLPASREEPRCGTLSPPQQQQPSCSELEKLRQELAAERQRCADLEAENLRLKRKKEHEQQAGHKTKLEHARHEHEELLPPGFVLPAGFVPTVSTPTVVPLQPPLPTVQLPTLLLPATGGALRDGPVAMATTAAPVSALITAASEVDTQLAPQASPL